MSDTDRARLAYRKEIARLNRATDADIDWAMAEREAAFAAERATARAEGFAAGEKSGLERAAQVAEHPNAGLVPPDGGDPSPDEMCRNIAATIRALPPVWGAKEEREAIVKFLRYHAAYVDSITLDQAAMAIEHNSHIERDQPTKLADYHLPKEPRMGEKLTAARPVIGMTPEQEARDNERDAEVKAKYPNGLTPALFRTLTLESADDDGRVYPPYVRWDHRFSLLMGMVIDGLIERENIGYNTPMLPYRITDKGRAALGQDSRRK